MTADAVQPAISPPQPGEPAGNSLSPLTRPPPKNRLVDRSPSDSVLGHLCVLLENVALVMFHTALLEEAEVFFFEAPNAMMLVLEFREQDTHPLINRRASDRRVSDRQRIARRFTRLDPPFSIVCTASSGATSSQTADAVQ